MARKARIRTLIKDARKDATPSNRRSASQMFIVCIALAMWICLKTGYTLVPPARTAEKLHRREVTALLFPVGLVAPAWLVGSDALAEESDQTSEGGVLDDIVSFRDEIVRSGRQKAKQEAKTGGLAGANRFLKPLRDQNVSDLQSFLPKLYLGQKHYETQLKSLNNPRVDLGNPDVYSNLRSDARKGPANDIRKTTKFVSLWIKKTEQDPRAAGVESERIKNAINTADTQMQRLAIRVEGSTGRVEAAATRTTKRNLQAIIDAIDDILVFIPEEEQKVALSLAETQVSQIPKLRLPLKSKKSKNKKNATAVSNSTASIPDSSSTAPPPAPESVLGSADKVRFGSLMEEAPVTK
mmetsp:Transcript_11252/g.19963  ORF Transcript_11252/g.19963 Transcript_11252/m.19963 type:complete len:353 (+) Transcript_11252:72-1130(+)